MNASQKTADSIREGRQRAMLSVDDVAMEIGCCARSVRRWADSGRMPKPVKLGSLIRWPRAVIEKWIADGCPNVRNVSKGVRS
jgi:predicted DNA-binding transcriptional regulator AlpA